METSASSICVLDSVQMGHRIILGSQESLIFLNYLCCFSCLLKILKAKILWRMNEQIRTIRGWGVQAAVVIRFAACMFSD